MSNEKRAMLTINGEDRRLVFDMGVLADIEDAGYDAQQMVDSITKSGATGQLVFLTWLLLAAGKAEGQSEITQDDIRRLPPYMRMQLLTAVLEAVKEGFVMETSTDEVRDPVLEEIEKKREQDG